MKNSNSPANAFFRPDILAGFLCAALLLFAGCRSAGRFAASGQDAALRPEHLRCEYRENPLGLDEPHPRLSWRLMANGRARFQTAYQIQVASSPELLGRGPADLWDSGKVAGDETVNIAYAGKPLASRQNCFWRVGVWDENGGQRWSGVASWTMGLLHPDDWQADFISLRDQSPLPTNREALHLPPAQQFRKEFAAGRQIERATLYATALGIYELHLNGQRVGDAFFAPGWTDYRQRAYYQTCDVTALVRGGTNVIGAWLADGWYAGYVGFGLLRGFGPERSGRFMYGKTPAFMAQLEIDYADGTRSTLVTDDSWRGTADGPVREADFLMGESYDARKESVGWSEAGFDDSPWPSAVEASQNGRVQATFYETTNAGPPKLVGRPVDLGFTRPPRLESFPGVPVRVTQELRPVAITSPTNGVHIFDFGQNFAGNVRLQVKGPPGTRLQLRYGEMLHPDGRLMTENLRKARATDYYTLRGGDATETWQPRFTFHGFQYVEVTGWPGEPGLDALTGLVLHSDTPMTSAFECSDPMVNRLFQNVLWTQRANFLDLPTDCPQRDERMGWTGDAQIYVRTATLNADVAAFFTKWLRELMESQRPSGTFPGYAPFPFQTGPEFGTAWCDAGVICPWTIWQAYNDTRIIERCWPHLVRFMEWRQRRATNFLGVAGGHGWGDWLSFGNKTPIEYIDTVYFAGSAKMMAEMAGAIGKTCEAAAYRKLFADIQSAFQQEYLRPDGSLTVDNQTAYALALSVGLIPAELRSQSGKILAEKLRTAETADNSGMTTGFLGTRPLLPALSDAGENDLAVAHFQSRKYPSWGYEVEQGATTIWERWNSYTKEHGFNGPDGKQNAGMNSFAHYSLGAVCEWMFTHLAGIDAGSPGYKTIIIRPHPPTAGSNPDRKPIDWVKAHYDSIRGRIAAEWRNSKDEFDLRVEIPPNTTATVFLPAAANSHILEGGRPISEVPAVKLLRMEQGAAVVSIGSGTYRFVVRKR